MAARPEGGARRRRPKPKRPAKQRPAKQRPGKRQPNPLYDPTVPLAGPDLRRAVNQLTRLEFRPRRQAINRAETNATAQGTALIDRAGGYYDQLASDVAGSVARQQAIGDRLRTALAASGTETQSTLEQAGQAADQRAAQDESVRGGGLEGGGGEQLARELAAQRALAARSTQTAQEDAAASTADWQNLTNVTAGATQARAAETRQQLINRLASQRAEFAGQRQDLDTEAADKRVENLLTLRRSGLEDLIAMRGLGIKSEQLRADIAQDRADRRIARERIRSTERNNQRQQETTRRGQDVTRRGQDIASQDRRRGQDITAEQRAADRRSREQIAAGKKKAHTNESADSRKTRNGIANALVDIQGGKERRVRRDAPPLVHRAASELNDVGFIRPQTVAKLKAAGVRIPKSWLPPSQRRGGRPRPSPGIPRNKR